MYLFQIILSFLKDDIGVDQRSFNCPDFVGSLFQSTGLY